MKLRKQIINSLSKAQLENVDARGEAVIEAEADKLLALFNSNLKEERVIDLGVFAGILDALVKYGRKSESNLEKTRDLYTKKYETELAELEKLATNTLEVKEEGGI
jgi:hypothetical protein